MAGRHGPRNREVFLKILRFGGLPCIGMALCCVLFPSSGRPMAVSIFQPTERRHGTNWKLRKMSIVLRCGDGPAVIEVDDATSFSAGYHDGGGGLFKSTDGGRTWLHILGDDQVWDVTLSPINPDIVYACCMATGSGPTRQVLRSNNGGKSWSRLSGLPFYNLHSITVDPEIPERCTSRLLEAEYGRPPLAMAQQAQLHRATRRCSRGNR